MRRRLLWACSKQTPRLGVSTTCYTVPCYTYARPQYDLKVQAERAWTAWKRSGRSSNILRSVHERYGRVRTSLVEMASQKFEKSTRPEIRRSTENEMIVLRTKLPYCDRTKDVPGRSAIELLLEVRSRNDLVRSFLTRSSRPNTDLTRSDNVLSASLLCVILIQSKQIVPNTFLHSPKRLKYVLGTLYRCSVRVVAFVSSPFNDNSVCSTIKSGGYKCGPSSHRII